MSIKYNYINFLSIKNEVLFITFESSVEIPKSVVWSVIRDFLVLQGEAPSSGDILKLIKKW